MYVRKHYGDKTTHIHSHQARERFEGEFASLHAMHLASAMSYRRFYFRVPRPLAVLGQPDKKTPGAMLVTEFLTMGPVGGNISFRYLGDAVAK